MRKVGQQGDRCLRGFVAAAASAAALAPTSAAAHIKWFAPYSVPAQPRLLHEVFNHSFGGLLLAALIGLVLLGYIERTGLGVAMLRVIERFTAPLKPRIEALYRGSTAIFFTALWVYGGIILTPELKTTLPAIPWLQAAIAFGMFWRFTTVIAAAGIAALYIYGVCAYGIFHLMDYPIFLGLAAYLALTGLDAKPFGIRPLDIARWGAGVTLMWAAFEKWAYPEWTYPILAQHQNLCLGFSSPFYMIAAGFVEFSLGFSLLWTPLVRRLAALALAAMFVSAVFDFGKIDAIGHLMIVVTLVGILVDDEPITRRPPLLAPPLYLGALAATMTLYYGGHALLFGTQIW